MFINYKYKAFLILLCIAVINSTSINERITIGILSMPVVPMGDNNDTT